MVFCVTFSYEPLSLPRCVVGPVGLAFYNSFRSARASFSEVSFLPYLFHEVYHTHMAKLYVSGADGVLNVWIDPREVRRAESCHDKKVAKCLWRMIGLLSLKLFCVSKFYSSFLCSFVSLNFLAEPSTCNLNQIQNNQEELGFLPFWLRCFPPGQGLPYSCQCYASWPRNMQGRRARQSKIGQFSTPNTNWYCFTTSK